MKKQSPMSPAEWGTAAWKFLHACSFAYPDNPTPEKQHAMKRVLENLGRILPCPKCAKHYEENIQQLPPRVENKENLSKWVVELHNRVNAARHMPTVDYNSVKRHYLENSGELERPYHKVVRRGSVTQHLVYGSTIVILLFALVVVARKRRR